MKQLTKSQRLALKYALLREKVALFMEMRMGKCLVVIRRMQLTNCKRILVVCPPSAMGGWSSELHDSQEDHTLILGTRQSKEHAINHVCFTHFPVRFWCIINWQAHRSQMDFHKVEWDCVIMDETSLYLRNPRSQVTKYYTAHFRNVPYRWILTGTPRPESDLDWYCQFKFLYDRPFGYSTYWNYRIKCFQQVGYSWHLKGERRNELKHYVAENSVIFKRRDWNMEPAKKTIKRSILMPPAVRKIYREVEHEWSTDNHETKWSLGLHHWLRKLSSGIDEDGHLFNPFKLNALDELMQDELKRDSVIIICNYNSEIASVCKYLRVFEISMPHACIIGKVSQQKRLDLIERFQEGEYRILILQQAVAQTGLDLSIADSCIFYSLPESGNAYSQIQDRMVHMTKLERSLTYYYLVTQDSIDEDIYNAVHVKRLTSEINIRRIIEAGINSRCQI